jgi:hypothetical protein
MRFYAPQAAQQSTTGSHSGNGRTPQESLNDAELRWLKALPGVTANTINDAWRQYLKGLGFLGDLNDMWLAYWERQP